MSTVRVAGVEKSFGSRRVLDGVEFAVEAGEFVAIIGPSGCGKSTVFNLLAGLEVPDRGAVTVRGDSPVSSSHCGHMPQKDLLFPWRSVLDNTALGLEVAGVPKAQARRGPRRCSRRSGWPGSRRRGRRSCRAGCVSVRRCCGPSCRNARCCCSTNPSALWTR